MGLNLAFHDLDLKKEECLPTYKLFKESKGESRPYLMFLAEALSQLKITGSGRISGLGRGAREEFNFS